MEDEHLGQLLRAKPGVVLQTYPNRAIRAALQAIVREVTGAGRNVALLVDAPRKLTDARFIDGWRMLLEGAYIADPFDEGNAFLGTVAEFSDKASDPTNDGWMDQLGLLLIPSGEDVLARPYAWELMAFQLRDRFALCSMAELPRTIVALQPRRKPESAIRDALPIYAVSNRSEHQAWTELRIESPEPARFWWTFWTSEDTRNYAYGLSGTNPPDFCGALGPLAQFAGRWGVDRRFNKVFFGERSGERDHEQNLQRTVQHLLYKPVAGTPWQWLAQESESFGAVTVSDSEGNPWRALHEAMGLSADIALCNVVCIDRMLTAYQIANPQWFSVHPLAPLSPLAALHVPFDTAVQLIHRIEAAGPLPAAAVRDMIVATKHPNSSTDPEVIDIFSAAQALVKEQLGSEIASQLRWVDKGEWKHNLQRAIHRRQGYLQLDGMDVARARVPWLDEFDVTVEGGALYDVVRREHVSQRYWPGKVVLLDGQKFIVDSVDQHAQRVFVTHADDTELPEYRRELRIECRDLPGGATAPTITTDGDHWLKLEWFTADLKISSERVAISLDQWSARPHVADLSAAQRVYPRARAVRISAGVRGSTHSGMTPKAAVTLATWLNEAMYTLLPESAEFLVAAPEVPESALPSTLEARTIVPWWTGPTLAAEGVGVWIFEDSQSDLGLVRALADELWYVLDICHDWLEWTLDEAPTAPIEPICFDNKVRPPRDWFAFGTPKRDGAFELMELRQALRSFKGHFRVVAGARRTSRVPSLLTDHGKASAVTCDICQEVVAAGRPFDVLPDGRISCQSCSEIGLRHSGQVQQLFDDLVAPFFREVHDIGSAWNVRIELVDQTAVSEAQGQRFIPTSGFDIRAIGLAVPHAGRLSSGTLQDSKRHTVMIESGFGPEATAVTLAHELCHVWQFNNLDMGPLDEDSQTLRREGHAVWTESSFLDWVARRSVPVFDAARLIKVRASHDLVRKSDSVYGRGYRWMTAQLSSSESAFQWLRRKYAIR